MQNPRSFSSQILTIFLPVSLVIVLLCISVSLVYFFRIRQIVFSGTEEIIQKTGEFTQSDLVRQARTGASLLAQERARNLGMKLESLSDSLHEIARLIRWGHQTYWEPIDPTLIPLATELTERNKGNQLHLTTPDGTRSFWADGKKIPDWRFLAPLFSAYRELEPEIQFIYFASADGYSLDYDEMGRYKRVNYDVRTRPWYEDAVKNNTITFTDPYEDIYRRGLTVTVSLPCWSKDNQLLGVVGIDYNVKNIYKKIREMNPDSTHYFLLLDRSGNVMVGPEDPREIEKLKKVLEPYLGRILQLKSGSKELGKDEEKRNYVFWDTVAFSNWKLLMVIPRSKVIGTAETASVRLLHLGRRIAANMDENIRFVAIYLVIMCAGAVVLMIAVSFRLAARLAKPISDLNEELKEMRRTGKFNADLQRSDELGALSRTLQDIFSDWEEEKETAQKSQKK